MSLGKCTVVWRTHYEIFGHGWLVVIFIKIWSMVIMKEEKKQDPVMNNQHRGQYSWSNQLPQRWNHQPQGDFYQKSARRKWTVKV